MDNSLGQKETNFKWFGNYLEGIFANQHEVLEKYLALLLCSNEQNSLLPEIWKPGFFTSFKPFFKITFPMRPYPTTLFKTVTFSPTTIYLPSLFAFIQSIYYYLINYIYHCFIYIFSDFLNWNASSMRAGLLFVLFVCLFSQWLE